MKLDRLPVTYPWVWLQFQRAAKATAIDRLGTHSLSPQLSFLAGRRGTAIAAQQKLMRHSDIRTTLNIYDDVVTNEKAEAPDKIVRLALSGPRDLR